MYKIESAHVVRNCTSKRCSHNYHGHSGKIEVFFKSRGLDTAGMIIDFGRLRKPIGAFIDMFDHSIHLWEGDDNDNIEFFKKKNERYVILPFNPTAENYALFFKCVINKLLSYIKPINGENGVYCKGVRYHETDTGYAESEQEDLEICNLKDIIVSYESMNSEMWEIYKAIPKDERWIIGD